MSRLTTLALFSIVSFFISAPTFAQDAPAIRGCILRDEITLDITIYLNKTLNNKGIRIGKAAWENLFNEILKESTERNLVVVVERPIDCPKGKTVFFRDGSEMKIPE
jgi:hypothetical protein